MGCTQFFRFSLFYLYIVQWSDYFSHDVPMNFIFKAVGTIDGISNVEF